MGRAAVMGMANAVLRGMTTFVDEVDLLASWHLLYRRTG